VHRPAARPRTVAGAATTALALLAVPAAASAAPTVRVVPTAAGPAALTAWVDGTNVLAAPAGGTPRTVARLARRTEDVRLMLDRSGQQLAVGTSDGLRVVDLVGGGLRVLSRSSAEAARVAWSPNGRGLLWTEGRRVRHCVLGTPAGCRRVLADAEEDSGPASWSPDGRSFVVTTSRPRKLDSGPASVVVVTGGVRRTVEALPFSDSTIGVPSPPVWTAAGPSWATVTLRVPKAPPAVRDDDLTLPLARFRPRYRVRLLGADGRVHTIGAADVPWDGSSSRPSPPVPAAAGPGGSVGITIRFGRDGRLTYAIGRLDLRGGFAPSWSTTVRPGAAGSEADDVTVAAVLGDGRIVVHRGAISDEDPLATTELRILDGPTGRGALLARGRALTVATPYPSPLADED
jgi:hypothetical protein